MKSIIFVAAMVWMVLAVVADNNFTTNLNMGANNITNVGSTFTSNITAYCYKDSRGNVITDFGALTANMYPALVTNIAKSLDTALSNTIPATVTNIATGLDTALSNTIPATVTNIATGLDTQQTTSIYAHIASVASTGTVFKALTSNYSMASATPAGATTENVAITNTEGNTITTLKFTNGVYIGHE